MVIMILDSCSVGCGWIGGLIGCVGLGSFGVPLKGEATNKVDDGKGAHMLVLQTYKSVMVFITSGLLLLLGESFHFTPMGIISALLWVSGGMAGIFGIRNAGLAISVGTWSGVCVLVSFVFGTFVFEERVYSAVATLCGISMPLAGFAGITYFSSPPATSNTTNMPSYDDIILSVGSNDSCNDMRESLLDDSSTDIHSTEETVDLQSSQRITFLGFQWNRRTLGIIGAAADGFLGRSIFIPMHYSSVKGLSYEISFAIGTAIVTAFYWILLYFYHTHQTGSFSSGYDALPSMHIRTLVYPGVIAGTTWSIGNIGNTLSVTYLGESVGMTVVQCQLVVSGLWGIVWFGEIEGVRLITGWMCSALLTLIGMSLIGREHVS